MQAVASGPELGVGEAASSFSEPKGFPGHRAWDGSRSPAPDPCSDTALPSDLG